MRLAWVLVAVGCGGGTSSVQLANTKPATTHPSASLDETWATLASGDIVARRPAGPFADLTDVCTAFRVAPSDETTAGCHVRTDHDDLAGPVRAIGRVQTWDPAGRVRLEHLALRTGAGWYVLPRIGDTGAAYRVGRTGVRSSDLAVQPPASIPRGIAIPYNFDLETEDGGVVEDGSIVCVVDGDVPACTPRIPTHRFTTSAGASRSILVLDCQLAVAGAQITVSPTPPRDPEDSAPWTAEAAAACRDLPYAGTHVVTF